MCGCVGVCVCERERERLSHTGVPDLGLDSLPINQDAASGKLHSNGALALQVELISGEPGEKVALANS